MRWCIKVLHHVQKSNAYEIEFCTMMQKNFADKRIKICEHKEFDHVFSGIKENTEKTYWSISTKTDREFLTKITKFRLYSDFYEKFLEFGTRIASI